MAETSKIFWGKFSKTKLKSAPFNPNLPSHLMEMFPDMDSAKLYYIYMSKCAKSMTKTVEYLTQNQSANYTDEIPIETLIESLQSIPTLQSKKKDYFSAVPTHLLTHIFCFTNPQTLGVLTRLNRECRLLSKALLSRIQSYDFSYFYHNLRNKKCKCVNDDDWRLVSHINAFQYLHSFSLRSTYFTKWNAFLQITDKIKQNMSELSLNNSINLFDDDIALICAVFPNLSKLDLSHCIELTDLSVTNIIENTFNQALHTLCLNNTPQITRNGIRQLLKYKKSVIDLQWKGAKYGNIHTCFESVQWSHVRSLNLSSNHSLQRLTLSYDGNGKELRLNLSNCSQLRLVTLDIPYLTALILTQCNKLTEVRIENAEKLREINCKNCKLLRLLSVPCKSVAIAQLRGCNALNLELLLHLQNFLMCSLSNGALHSLDLSQMHQITNENMDQILEIHKGSLKGVCVYECRQVSAAKRAFIHTTFAKPIRNNSVRLQNRKQRSLNRKKHSKY